MLLDSPNQLRAHEFRRLVEQGLHAFDEVYCMRQSGVEVKSGFIFPAGVNEKQPPIVCRAERLNCNAFGFGASRIQNGTESFFGSVFTTFTNMEPGKKETWH